VKAGLCFVQAMAVLAVFAVARSFGLLGPAVISVSLLTAALVLIAWSAGATRADLGLARAAMRPGLLYGAAAFGVVLLVLVAAAVIPATNGFLHDSRAQIGGGRLLYEIGVPIVLLTAIPEEFAFRGVLLGSALRLWGPWRASLITSALFGLWHIAPTLHTMSDNREFAGAAAIPAPGTHVTATAPARADDGRGPASPCPCFMPRGWYRRLPVRWPRSTRGG
jgi:membrane protease YdiL (CAAX protease family)